MKVLYIDSKLKNLKLELSKEEINKLPKKIFLAYSIQYKDLAKSIKSQLESSSINIAKFQQVLGCSKINTKLPVLLIGTGRFHAINLYLQAPEFFLLENNKIIKIPQQEIETIRIKRKTALMKFFNADKIGILVSTKPGQENLNQAIKIKQKLKTKGKEAYIFLSNNINTAEFENFNIDSWVNTACHGLALDNTDIINYSEIDV
jgi:2-(3-amino-3-carboxypropyl)histidine synthase